MINKTIRDTDQQDLWIKQQIQEGYFKNESELVGELISSRQIQQAENMTEINAIRDALVEGEKSGICNQDIDEIWKEARCTNVSI